MTPIQEICGIMVMGQDRAQEVNRMERAMLTGKLAATQQLQKTIEMRRFYQEQFSELIAGNLARFAAANDSSLTPEVA
jgi:hypothetical protein